MGVKATRVVKFIRKGDKGSDAVRYWLIPSVSSVSMADVKGGDGKPTPSSVTCRLVKQVGDDTPTTIATPSSVDLTIQYTILRNDDLLNVVENYTGAVTVPTNTACRAIEFYLYRGRLLIDTATVAIVCDGEQGQPGNDGVSYSVILSPNSVAVTADGTVISDSSLITAKAYKNVGGVTTEATDGAMRLFFTKQNGTTSNAAATGMSAGGAAIFTAVWFEYRVNDKTVATAALTINREGQKGNDGERGPALRGPQAWSDCATGYAFKGGAKGEAWKDVVIYQNNYYSCINSHTKTTSNYPGSTADQSNHYWQLGDKIELVATKILLASYALVKNLGVECIDMRDAAGNILFQAKDGNVTCKTGTFDGITVRNAEIESGHIAGFEVSGTGLTNAPFTNDAYIIFRNDAHNCFAGMGGNVLPATSGARAVARFENNDAKDQWGLGRNIALLLSAENGQYNHAFCGVGNGTLDGWIGGHKFSKYTLANSNTIYNGFVNLRENNKWIIYAASNISGSGIVLPSLSEVQDALGIGTNKAFCVEFTILADLHTRGFYVYGRNKLKDNNNATPWDTEQIPVLSHWNNGRDDRITMDAGDCMTVLLIYDPNKTGVLDDFSLQYTARRIYHTS